MAEMWRTVPDDEKLQFKRMAAEMQHQFKLKNPNYVYRKVHKRRHDLEDAQSDTRVTPPVPYSFRWDELLNHHNDA
jgi:hypothetical protein